MTGSKSRGESGGTKNAEGPSLLPPQAFELTAVELACAIRFF